MSKSHETGPDQGMSGEHFPALIAIENLIGQTQENLALNDPAGYVLGYVSWTTNKFTALPTPQSQDRLAYMGLPKRIAEVLHSDSDLSLEESIEGAEIAAALWTGLPQQDVWQLLPELDTPVTESKIDYLERMMTLHSPHSSTVASIMAHNMTLDNPTQRT